MNDFFDNIEDIETQENVCSPHEYTHMFGVKIDNYAIFHTGLGLLGFKDLIKRNVDSVVFKDSELSFEYKMSLTPQNNNYLINYFVIIKVFGRFCSLRDFVSFIFAINEFNKKKAGYTILWHITESNCSYTIDMNSLMDSFNTYQNMSSNTYIQFKDMAKDIIGDYSINELNYIFKRIPQYIEKRELQFSFLMQQKTKKVASKKRIEELMKMNIDFNTPYRIFDYKRILHPEILKEEITTDDSNNQVYILADTDDSLKSVTYISTRTIQSNQVPYMWKYGYRKCYVTDLILNNLNKLKRQEFNKRFCQFHVSKQHYCHLSFIAGILYDRDTNQNIYISIGMNGTQSFIDSMITKLFMA